MHEGSLQKALPSDTHRHHSVGTLLRRWRGARHVSQLTLAAQAELSSRHLSFIESGRARPGREALLRMAEALDLPMRARNELLIAAGYAPLFRESPLHTLPQDGIPAVLQHLLNQQEPFPAMVADRSWNVITCNAAMVRMSRAFIDGASYRAAGEAARNAMKQIFDPRLLRPWVQNWSEVAREILLRLHHESADAVVGAPAAALLDELLRYPDAPALRGSHPGLAPNAPAMTVSLRRGDLQVRYVSMLSTFGTPQDVTLQELRIKLFYPADAESAEVFRRMAVLGAAQPRVNPHPAA